MMHGGSLLKAPEVAAPMRQAFDPEAWNLDDMSPKSGWASLFNQRP